MFSLSRHILLLLGLVISNGIFGQTIYYPSNSSQLLKSTAEDYSSLLARAIPLGNFTVSEAGSITPSTGIFFIYDSSIASGNTCLIQSDGSTFLKFIASGDNGLNYGAYRYLSELGFRFYLPGSLWEKVPSLTSPFRSVNKILNSSFLYNGWFISGGHQAWAMDKDRYDWDVYSGGNGHDWALYQRRNFMTGEYRFNGHRGDVMDQQYFQTLSNNPCFVAAHDGVRTIAHSSVPDINNTGAKDAWADIIKTKYTGYRDIVTGNKNLYADLYHNFEYFNNRISLEVPDGAAWGNSLSDGSCTAGNWDGEPYPSASDQQFMLVDHSAKKIGLTLPDKRFQCYAYSAHANTPSSSIGISNKIDVQVVPSAFQLESSEKGLMKKWYGRHSNVSEYHYINIPQWGGELPQTSSEDFEQRVERIRRQHGQGITIETSPAKFSSLTLLYSMNLFLNDSIPMGTSRSEFIGEMFPGQAGTYIDQLLRSWSDDLTYTLGEYYSDNIYKVPLYLSLLEKATNAAGSDQLVLSRLREIKAYLHYMILYHDFRNDRKDPLLKTSKARSLCNYLAKVNKLKIVNSYFLIQDILWKYPANHTLWQEFDIQTGNAYPSLNLITGSEIDQDFAADVLAYGSRVSNYRIEDELKVVSSMIDNNVVPLSKIDFKLAYTNGQDYPNITEIYLYAPHPGSFSINCQPSFNMPGKGFINVTVEAADEPMNILKDVTITRTNNPGKITVNIPAGGFYKLTLISKYKTGNHLVIETNGNTFFRKGPFYGGMVENYRENWLNLPRFVHIPQGTGRLYFSVNNGCDLNGNCINASNVEDAFDIRNLNNERLSVNPSSSDPALFYIDIPSSMQGSFIEVSRMREYNLCFSNISNIELYAERKICDASEFSIGLVKKNGECISCTCFEILLI